MLQEQIVMSFAARALAVKKVSGNKGSKNPGPDGIVWTTDTQRMEAIKSLRTLGATEANQFGGYT